MGSIDNTEDLVAAARAQGLQLISERASLDDTGADFLVAHALDEHAVQWVVRTPRRADVLERAEREYRILALLSTRLPVAVPNWRIFSPKVIAYPRLSGEPAAIIDMNVGGYVWRFDETDPPAAF